jgi:hypothetical protein
LTVLMPFGRYRGWLLSELPEDYLAWLRARPNLREPLRSCCDLEWERRMHAAGRPSPARDETGAVRVEPEDFAMFRELVQAGFRQMALRFHPDHGGRAEDMRALNLLMEKLREQLRKD